MRRLHLGVLASVVPALLASLMLVGCGGKDEKGTGDTSKPTDAGKRGSASSGPMKAVEPGTGTLKGKVTLQGAKPDMKALTDDLLKAINMKADDAKYCLMSPEDQRTAQEWRIGDNNGVGNVFVWIAPLPNEFFKIDEKQLAAVPKEVTIEQPFCAFKPHCVILFPQYKDPKNPKKLKETGQKFVVKNDAKISHNTKFSAGPKNEPFDQTLPPMSHKDVPVLEPTSDEITVRCGIHPWMAAYGRAFDHPYATLSAVGKAAGDASYGTYELKNLPAGKLRVIAWHPKAGYLNGAKGEEIDLKAGDNPPKDFSITANK
jgi:hypothetical protein